ncbi:MAG: protoporphyrinogen oxidase [Acidobacteriota bacterium]
MADLVDSLVIGAGPAGLAAAMALLDAGDDPLVLEAANEAGGYLGSLPEGDYLLPRGPHALPGSAAASFQLLERLGLLERAIPARAAARRYLWQGRLVALPTGPGSFLTSSFLSLGGKLRLLSEPLRGRPSTVDPHESVLDFFTRRFGAEAASELAAPFVNGVYAGDPSALEARSAFPRVWDLEERAGSLVRGLVRGGRGGRKKTTARRRGLWSLPRGLGEIADAAAEVLRDRLQCGRAVVALKDDGDAMVVETETTSHRARRVVLAVPPPAAAPLLAAVDDESSELARGVPLAPVAVVHLGGPLDEATAPSGFGVLVHPRHELATLGMVFCSALFPERVPTGCWHSASYLGGTRRPELVERDDDTLIETAATEGERLLGFRPERGLAKVLRYPGAIPQLVHGHRDRITRLRERVGARTPRLRLAGNWLDGVGVEQAVASGQRAVEELAA